MIKKCGIFLLCLTLALSCCSCGITDLFNAVGITQANSATAAPAYTAEPSETSEIPEITVDKMDFAGKDLSEYISLEYKGIVLSSAQEIRTITDEILDEELDSIILYYGYYTLDTSRKTAEGDTIEIAYTGYMDGETFSGGSSEKTTILLDKENSGFIDGFADGLIDVTPGETVDLNLTFPEDYTSTLAGKAVTFKVTVHGICKTELTDEIAVKLSSDKYKTVAEYRAYFKTYLEEMDRYLQFSDVYSDIWEKLDELAVIKEYPDQEVQYWYEYYVNYFASMAAYYSTTYDYIMTYYGYTEESLQEEARAITKERLIIFYIANSENCIVDDEVYREYLNNMVESYKSQGYTYSADEIESFYSSNYGETYLREKAQQEKVIDAVYNYASVIYVPETE